VALCAKSTCKRFLTPIKVWKCEHFPLNQKVGVACDIPFTKTRSVLPKPPNGCFRIDRPLLLRGHEIRDVKFGAKVEPTQFSMRHTDGLACQGPEE
jgi:hypothetical protein